MSHLVDQERAERELQPQGLTGTWSAIVAEPATDMDTKIHVVIPGFSDGLQVGPCRWQARDATSLPARGDRCLVTFDDHHEPWVPIWWPFDS